MSIPGRLPFLSNEALSRIIRSYFNFKEVQENSIKLLPGYDDSNFYFKGEYVDGHFDNEFLLKLRNPLYISRNEVEGLNSLMRHLNSCGITSSYPLSSNKGPDVIQLMSEELVAEMNHNQVQVGLTDTTSVEESHINDISTIKATREVNEYEPQFHYMCLLTFLPGKLFDRIERKYLTPALLLEIGEVIGKTDKELMENFSNKALVSRYHNWDLMECLEVKKYIRDIEDRSQRNCLRKILKVFEEDVSPRIPSFRRGIIHNDLNGLNIVLEYKESSDAYHFKGLIDFGDSILSCTVFDLAICIAHMLMMIANLEPAASSSTIVEFVGPLIHGYNSILPLNPDELHSLYHLVLARCCQSAVFTTRSAKAEPWNTYLVNYPKKVWTLLEKLATIPKEEVDSIWRSYL